jgi:hypothetical protein
MDAQTIKAFQTAIASTHWNMDFNEFCRRTGFVGEYAKQKWQDWKNLHESLAKFDPETLAKITGG